MGHTDWELYDTTEGIEVMTTREAREEFDVNVAPGHTIVGDGVFVLAVAGEETEGFAIFGTETELRNWLDRAGRVLDRALDRHRLTC